MNQTIYDLILIGIAAITTFLLRALPFLRKTQYAFYGTESIGIIAAGDYGSIGCVLHQRQH